MTKYLVGIFMVAALSVAGAQPIQTESTNTSTSTNTNTNINTNTSTSSSTNNNFNHNTGDITNRNFNHNTGEQTFNNNNVSTSTSVNTNNNHQTGDMTNRNINTTNSTNTNNNVNHTTGDMTNRNITESTQTIRQPPPTAVAPAVTTINNDVCAVVASGAVQTQIFGISMGGTLRDMNCERIKLAKNLFDMGMKVAAVATLCQDERVFAAMMAAGTPCPIDGKIGAQARQEWESRGVRVETEKIGFYAVSAPGDRSNCEYQGDDPIVQRRVCGQ